MIMKISHNDFIILIHCCKVRTYKNERRRVAHSTFGKLKPSSHYSIIVTVVFDEISPVLFLSHKSAWLFLLVEKLASENTVLDTV